MNDHQKITPEQTAKVARHHENVQKHEKRRQLHTVRKKLKRNIQTKGPRRKGWQIEDFDGSDESDISTQERIMPRDESDRRRSIKQAAFMTPEFGEDVTADTRPGSTGTRKGLVVSTSSGLCRVELGERVLLCGIRGSLTSEETPFTNVVAAGDEVVVREDGTGGGVVEQVLPRRSALARPDVFYAHRQQVLVANAEQLLVVASWREPIIWLELIDRYLISAERGNLEAIICVTKADLIDDDTAYAEAVAPYHALGHRVIRSSALTGEGINETREALHGKSTVLAGMSGAGKSSLLTAVQPGLQIRTAEVNEHSGEGRHTTTQTTLHRLKEGGSVIDTPGIREFGLIGLRKRDLAHFFPEIVSAAPSCRFANCSHIEEPDCAVREAELAGRVPASRYHNYKMIHGTLPG